MCIRDSPKSDTPEIVKIEKVPDEKNEPKAKRNRARSNDTEDIVAQYLESPNPVFPKVFSLNNVQFEGESSELDGTNEQILHIADLMKQYPKMKIDVYGYTAGAESEEQAVQLKWQEIGVQRAKTIEAILKNNGISKRRMSPKARRQRRAITEKYWGAVIVIKNK